MTAIKEVYVGSRKIWPTEKVIYEYSTTFDDSTGWTLGAATVSGGEISAKASSQSTYYMGSYFNASTINKLTIEATCTGNATARSGGMHIGVSRAPLTYSAINDTSDCLCFFVNYSTATSGYNKSGIRFNQTGNYTTYTIATTTTKYEGTRLWTAEIDIVNKKGTLYIDGTQVAQSDLPESGISALTYPIGYIGVVWDSRQALKSIQDLHIKVV